MPQRALLNALRATEREELPGIRTFGWGQNYYIDEAGNKINLNPNFGYYYDPQGRKQYFDKPQIDWTKVPFGQNPFAVEGALLGDETMLSSPYGQPSVSMIAPNITAETPWGESATTGQLTPRAPRPSPMPFGAQGGYGRRRNPLEEALRRLQGGM